MQNQTAQTQINAVQCHICPLKDLCIYEHKHSSYVIAHQQYKNQKEMLNRLRRIAESTKNCPLLKLTTEIETEEHIGETIN